MNDPNETLADIYAENAGLTWQEATCGTEDDIHEAEWGY